MSFAFVSRASSSILSAALLCLATNAQGWASAFMLPVGQGQFIAGVGYAAGSRRFDSSGTAVPAATYRKVEASGYLEYGLTPWLSLIAAPTVARENGAVATNSVTGSDSSAFGARVALFSWSRGVVAFQVLVQPPLGGDMTSQIAEGGARSLAVDLRVPIGWSFRFFGLPAFVDVQPGARLRAEPFPTEARVDLTLGVRVTAPLMVLVQDFTALAPSSGPLIPRCDYSKVEASLVYDLSARWSVQAGGFRTIAGRNAVRETGPQAALWYRF